MSRKLLYILYCICTGLLFVSCDSDEIYFNFRELESSEWSKSDTLCFDIDSSSIVLNKPVRFDIELANNSDYPYQNIWLHIQDNFSNDSVYTTLEKQYGLCDEYGKWYGSGFGSLYQLSLEYRKNILFKEKRNYRVKIIQGMRDEPLTGIEKIGIKLSLDSD